jgi:large subunit ribosomal protein L4
MKLQIINTKKEQIAEKTLHKGLAEGQVKLEALGQYLRVFMFNQRQGTASAKTRGEVSGSGIKPWKQKGTGRARVGSKRTPLWRHGGIVHAPKPKSWNLSLNKNVRRVALISALSHKFNEDAVTVIDSFDDFGSKTKDNMKHLKKLDLIRNVLIVTDEVKKDLLQGLGNIKGLNTSLVETLNAFEVFKADKILISKAALEALEKKLFKTK